jgi:hypothetical protein
MFNSIIGMYRMYDECIEGVVVVVVSLCLMLLLANNIKEWGMRET